MFYPYPSKLSTFCWLFDYNILSNQVDKNNINDVQQLASLLANYRFQYYEELKENIFIIKRNLSRLCFRKK